jgi:hypothetical protein
MAAHCYSCLLPSLLACWLFHDEMHRCCMYIAFGTPHHTSSSPPDQPTDVNDESWERSNPLAASIVISRRQ